MPRSCAYVAGPLDSGGAYYEKVAVGLVSPKVREENEKRLGGFVEHLRSTLPYPVFDPGTLKVDGWTDAQHGAFFIRVLEKVAKEAWFINGWEFSHGATREFMHCTSLKIPCLNEMGGIIDLNAGRMMIGNAAEYVSSLGLDASRLRSRLR